MTRALKLLHARLDTSSGLRQLPDPSASTLSLAGIAVASALWCEWSVLSVLTRGQFDELPYFLTL